MSEVRIDLTREDADRLESNCQCEQISQCGGCRLRASIVAAIREQVPAPLEIPENLGAVVVDAEGRTYTHTGRQDDLPWYGRGCGWFTPQQVRRVAVKVLSEGVPR